MDQNFLGLVARTVLHVARVWLQARILRRIRQRDSASRGIALIAAGDATMVGVPASRAVRAGGAVLLVEEDFEGRETDDDDRDGRFDRGPESQPDWFRVGVGRVGDDDADDGEDDDDDAEADYGADGQLLFPGALDDPEEFPWEEDD